MFVGAGVEGETAVVTGGVLAHRGLLPLGGVVAAAIAGSFVADQLFFAAGRRFRDTGPVRRFRERPAFARALALLERHPRGFIFAYRFVYGIRTASPVAIGTSTIPTRTFVAVNAVAAIVWGGLFAALGALFGGAIERMIGRFHAHWVLAAASVVALGAAIFLWWRGRRT